MKYNVIKLFYSELPVVICTKNSYVSEANPVAAARLKHISEGETLFTYMSPYDRLRYEASYDSSNVSSVLVFPLEGYHGYHFAAAVFETLMGRRFAEVGLFRNEAAYMKSRPLFEMSGNELCPPAEVSEFLTSFSRIEDKVFDSDDYCHLIDLKAVTQRAIRDISEKSCSIDSEFVYSENSEMEDTQCMPSSVSVGNYLRMLISMAFVMNDITCDRVISVRLCRYGEDAELRVSAKTSRISECVADIDNLTELLPSCAVKLAVCNYIAGKCKATLGVSQANSLDTLTLTLLISRSEPEIVDFKSRDQFRYYDSALNTAVEDITELQ